MVALIFLYILPAIIVLLGTAEYVIEDNTKGLAIKFLAIIPVVNFFFAVIVVGCVIAYMVAYSRGK